MINYKYYLFNSLQSVAQTSVPSAPKIQEPEQVKQEITIVEIIENNTKVDMNIEESLFKLLKLLHVYSRYQTTTQLQLPDEIGYIGMSLLGLASVSSFYDRLNSSLRFANYYLNVINYHNICTILLIHFN